MFIVLQYPQQHRSASPTPHSRYEYPEPQPRQRQRSTTEPQMNTTTRPLSRPRTAYPTIYPTTDPAIHQQQPHFNYDKYASEYPAPRNPSASQRPTSYLPSQNNSYLKTNQQRQPAAPTSNLYNRYERSRTPQPPPMYPSATTTKKPTAVPPATTKTANHHCSTQHCSDANDDIMLNSIYEEIRSSTAAKQIALNYPDPNLSPTSYSAISIDGDFSDEQPKTIAPTTAATSTATAKNPPTDASNQCETRHTVSESVVFTQPASLSNKSSDMSTQSQSNDAGAGDTATGGALAASAAITSFAQTIDEACGLEKSKKMIVRLIDTAIRSLRTKESLSQMSMANSTKQKGVGGGDSPPQTKPTNDGSQADLMSSLQSTITAKSKSMKRDCIRKIEDELERLKQLEEFTDVCDAI